MVWIKGTSIAFWAGLFCILKDAIVGVDYASECCANWELLLTKSAIFMLAAGEWSCILKIRHDVQHTLVPSPYEFLLDFQTFRGMVGCMGIRSHNFTISP